MTNKNAPGRSTTCVQHRSDQPDDLFLQSLPIYVVIFVPDHQIHGQPLEAPIGMRLHKLANQSILLALAICSNTIGRSPEME